MSGRVFPLCAALSSLSFRPPRVRPLVSNKVSLSLSLSLLRVDQEVTPSLDYREGQPTPSLCAHSRDPPPSPLRRSANDRQPCARSQIRLRRALRAERLLSPTPFCHRSPWKRFDDNDQGVPRP